MVPGTTPCRDPEDANYVERTIPGRFGLFGRGAVNVLVAETRFCQILRQGDRT